MKNTAHKRAFYTLCGCIAALALAVAAALCLLAPAPAAFDVAIPGRRGEIPATVQLPGKLARGTELPLVVLCHGFTGSRSGDGHFAPLAADLAALLRAGISGSEYITLEEELELIGRYLAIQEVRFGDRFVCELDVDERFQRCVVPKLILQPLVENAIIHGVADSDEGFIKLWAEEDAEGYLLLKVSDNGSGIPPEVLERLNSHELIPGGHLGLNNVDRIVRLSYGESCGLSAYPNEGGGSCVQLRLPMQKGEDHAQGTDR